MQVGRRRLQRTSDLFLSHTPTPPDPRNRTWNPSEHILAYSNDTQNNQSHILPAYTPQENEDMSLMSRINAPQMPAPPPPPTAAANQINPAPTYAAFTGFNFRTRLADRIENSTTSGHENAQATNNTSTPPSQSPAKRTRGLRGQHRGEDTRHQDAQGERRSLLARVDLSTPVVSDGPRPEQRKSDNPELPTRNAAGHQQTQSHWAPLGATLASNKKASQPNRPVVQDEPANSESRMRYPFKQIPKGPADAPGTSKGKGKSNAPPSAAVPPLQSRLNELSSNPWKDNVAPSMSTPPALNRAPAPQLHALTATTAPTRAAATDTSFDMFDPEALSALSVQVSKPKSTAPAKVVPALAAPTTTPAITESTRNTQPQQPPSAPIPPITTALTVVSRGSDNPVANHRPLIPLAEPSPGSSAPATPGSSSSAAPSGFTTSTPRFISGGLVVLNRSTPQSSSPAPVPAAATPQSTVATIPTHPRPDLSPAFAPAAVTQAEWESVAVLRTEYAELKRRRDELAAREADTVTAANAFAEQAEKWLGLVEGYMGGERPRRQPEVQEQDVLSGPVGQGMTPEGARVTSPENDMDLDSDSPGTSPQGFAPVVTQDQAQGLLSVPHQDVLQVVPMVTTTDHKSEELYRPDMTDMDISMASSVGATLAPSPSPRSPVALALNWAPKPTSPIETRAPPAPPLNLHTDTTSEDNPALAPRQSGIQELRALVEDQKRLTGSKASRVKTLADAGQSGKNPIVNPSNTGKKSATTATVPSATPQKVDRGLMITKVTPTAGSGPVPSGSGSATSLPPVSHPLLRKPTQATSADPGSDIHPKDEDVKKPDIAQSTQVQNDEAARLLQRQDELRRRRDREAEIALVRRQAEADAARAQQEEEDYKRRSVQAIAQRRAIEEKKKLAMQEEARRITQQKHEVATVSYSPPVPVPPRMPSEEEVKPIIAPPVDLQPPARRIAQAPKPEEMPRPPAHVKEIPKVESPPLNHAAASSSTLASAVDLPICSPVAVKRGYDEYDNNRPVLSGSVKKPRLNYGNEIKSPVVHRQQPALPTQAPEVCQTPPWTFEARPPAFSMPGASPIGPMDSQAPGSYSLLLQSPPSSGFGGSPSQGSSRHDAYAPGPSYLPSRSYDFSPRQDAIDHRHRLPARSPPRTDYVHDSHDARPHSPPYPRQARSPSPRRSGPPFMRDEPPHAARRLRPISSYERAPPARPDWNSYRPGSPAPRADRPSGYGRPRSPSPPRYAPARYGPTQSLRREYSRRSRSVSPVRSDYRPGMFRDRVAVRDVPGVGRGMRGRGPRSPPPHSVRDRYRRSPSPPPRKINRQ